MVVVVVIYICSCICMVVVVCVNELGQPADLMRLARKASNNEQEEAKNNRQKHSESINHDFSCDRCITIHQIT